MALVALVRAADVCVCECGRTGSGDVMRKHKEDVQKQHQMCIVLVVYLLFIQHPPSTLCPTRRLFMRGTSAAGALVCGLKRPELYASVSALAPLCNPS